MNIRHFNLRGCVRPFSLLSSPGKLVMGSICYFTFKSFSSQIDVTSPKAESFCLVCTIQCTGIPRFRCCFVASVEGWDTGKKDRAVQSQTFAD